MFEKCGISREKDYETLNLKISQSTHLIFYPSFSILSVDLYEHDSGQIAVNEKSTQY